METSAAPPPTKRVRVADGPCLKNITECIRQFSLPRQYPSMTERKRISILRGKRTLTVASPLTKARAVTIVAPTKTDAPAPSKLQKLRIKSADGKDLGQINVQLLSQRNDTLKGKTIMITKADVLKALSDPNSVATLQRKNKLGEVAKVSQTPQNREPSTVKSSNASVGMVLSPVKSPANGARNTAASSPSDCVRRLPVILPKEHGSEKEACTKSKKVVKMTRKYKSTNRIEINDEVVLKNSLKPSVDNTIRKRKFPMILPKGPVKQSEKSSNNIEIVAQSENIQSKQQPVQGKSTVIIPNTISGLVPKFVKIPTSQKLILMSTNNNTVVVNNGANIKPPSTPLAPNGKVKSISLMFESPKTDTQEPLKSIQHRQYADIKYPIVLCKKLLTPITQDDCQIDASEEQTTVPKTNGKVCCNPSRTDKGKAKVKQADNRTVKTNKLTVNKEEKVQRVTPKEKRDQLRIKDISPNKNASLIDQSNKTNVTTVPTEILTSNKIISTRTKSPGESSTNANDVPHCSIEGRESVSDKTEDEESVKSRKNTGCTPESTSMEADNASDSSLNIKRSADNSLQKQLSSWSILETAVNSMKDEKLRVAALKALADCRIGGERYVPQTPPEDKKAVHDSTVQTEVFGLLDTENFTLVREDLPNVQRIRQCESSLSNIPLMRENLPLQNNLLGDDNRITSTLNIAGDLDNFDLSTFFSNYSTNNEGANKVEQVLSRPSTECTKVFNQLKKDIDSATQYDENGLLSIHKAVISNRLNDFQRYLMILQGRQETVDIPTYEGMTCLELAIKYDVNPKIVSLLLEAGAHPVLPEPLHESALIIACKNSMPVVTDLIRHIKHKELLDQIDAEGFAALHYCAINGYLDAVKALVQAQADVNIRDKRSGRTALFHAIENDRIPVAQWLLDKGASTNVQNFSGQTVFFLAGEIKNLSFKTTLTRLAQ